MSHMLKLEKVSNYVDTNDLNREVLEQAEIQVKYAGYIAKEKKLDILELTDRFIVLRKKGFTKKMTVFFLPKTLLS